MLTEIKGKQYIKYTDEVEFKLRNNQGVRDRDIKEAISVNFIGEKWKFKERIIEENIYQKIRNRLDEFNFDYPCDFNDRQFEQWLKEKNFYPRLLEYLSTGIFVKKEYMRCIFCLKGIDERLLDRSDSKFKIEILFLIDRIDIEFRKNILSWFIGMENAYKTYFMSLSNSYEGNNIAVEVIE